MKSKGKGMKIIMAAISAVAILFLMASCDDNRYQVELVDPNAVVSFETTVQPLFSQNCISCHGAIRDPDLREGNSYEALITGDYVELPAESSKLYEMITSSSHTPYLEDADRFKILYWIQQGAQEN